MNSSLYVDEAHYSCKFFLLPYWKDNTDKIQIVSEVGRMVNLCTVKGLHQEIIFKSLQNGMQNIIHANKSLPSNQIVK